MLIDLSELDILDKKLKLFSYNKFNIISFYNKDHGPRDGSSLKNWVIDNLKKNNIDTRRIFKLNFYVILGYLVMYLIH